MKTTMLLNYWGVYRGHNQDPSKPLAQVVSREKATVRTTVYLLLNIPGPEGLNAEIIYTPAASRGLLN